MEKLPSWLESDAGANVELRRFIELHSIPVHSFRNRKLDEADFLPATTKISALNWSSFSAKKDSYFYSLLLEEALKRFGNSHEFIDLCCGSGIPMISAWERLGGGTALRGRFYDIDEEAIATASGNLMAAGLSTQVSASVKTVTDFIQGTEMGNPDQIVCVNPPYIPFPLDEVPTAFRTVAAGRDGMKFTAPFLEGRFGNRSRLVLEWSSLCEVSQVLQAIANGFEVEFSIACEMPFGRYTNSDEIYPYLSRLREQKRVAFGGEEGAESQILFGMILRPGTGDTAG